MQKKIKLNLNNAIKFENHRSGWDYVIRSLSQLHDPNGLYLEDFIENTFGWKYCNYDSNSLKDVYYHNKTYQIKYKNVRLHENDHAVRLDENLYVKFNRTENRWRRIQKMNSYKWKKMPYAYRNIIYRMPWIGFMHNVPDVPVWFDYHNSPYQILNRPEIRESLEHCEGIFVLSEYLKKWLIEFFRQAHIDVKVNSLIHPTETPLIKFKWINFKKNNEKKIVQVGYWLRNMSYIWNLRTSYKKVWLYGDNYAINCLEREIMNCDKNKKILDKLKKCDNYNGKRISDVQLLKLSNDEYDKLLSENICVLNLYDSSCNNTIIECIVRNTPIIVNKLPAVVEYLGADYPLYANSTTEAEKILEDNDLLKKGYLYLKKMDKTVFTGEYFLESFKNSQIYKDLVKNYYNKPIDQPDNRHSRKWNRWCSSGSCLNENCNVHQGCRCY